MRRFLAFLLVAVVGCGLYTTPTVTKPDAEEGPSAEIDFAQWPTATEQPMPVDPAIATACAMPLSNHVYEERKKAHGPHFKPSIVVRVNPAAIKAFKSQKAMPVGSTIVKEKHDIYPPKGPPQEYAAMVKREPGYDPAHGDWEYLYVVRGKPLTITRGKLGSCIDCHEGKKETDYLFRTYRLAAPPPANGIK